MTGKPIALCLGGAKTVWDDLAAARALLADRPALIVACNFAGIQYVDRIDAWVTLHHEMFTPWRETRAWQGHNTDYRAFVHAPYHGVVAEVVPQTWYGSSGLYAAQVALEALGCAAAILCGVPMDEDAGHIHWPGLWRHEHTARYRAGVEQAKADGAAVRSMSGWTASVLGRPYTTWLTWLSEVEAT